VNNVGTGWVIAFVAQSPGKRTHSSLHDKTFQFFIYEIARTIKDTVKELLSNKIFSASHQFTQSLRFIRRHEEDCDEVKKTSDV